jgi:DNA-binding transcriptional ArsR family regulator
MAIKHTHSLSDSQLSEIARIFSVLAEPSRLKLLRGLIKRPMTVTELVEETGMKQGNVSKHLGTLLTASFVERTSDGNFARYALIDQTVIELCQMMCLRVERQAKKRLRALQ